MGIVAAVFLFVAIVAGGGGADAPFVNGIIEGLAAILFTASVAAHFAGRPLPRQSLGPILFLLAALLLIALQLVPLPPEIWTELPGRETAVVVSELIGRPGDWRPLSLDPEATRRHAAALLVPAAILVAGLGASHRGLILMARSVVAAALLSALLGAAQIALGSPDSLAFHDAPAQGIATGVFANPNHQAQLMLAGLIMAGLLIRLERPQVSVRTRRGYVMLHLGWLLFPMFMAGAVAAESRAVIALLVPATAAATIVALRRKGTGGLLVILLALIAAGVAIYAVTPGSVARVMQLQETLLDGRVVFLPDVLFTLQQYWPWGSGLGTFVPVFQANENLDLLQRFRVNHAHNDLLEILLEAGLPGAILLAAAVAGLIWRFARVAMSRGAFDSGPALAGIAMLALMLLHSLVDYPIRTRAIGAVAAFALVLIFSPAQQRPVTEDAAQRRSRRKGFRRSVARGPSFSAGAQR